MRKLVIFILTIPFILGCEDKPVINSNPIDLSSCFSPEFGTIEAEQFFFNLQFGELTVNLVENITSQNPGYLIREGSNIVFVYRHFFENSFNIDDDEVEVRILFEVDGDSDFFEIASDRDFENSNCIYSECGIALQTITGNINGSKSSDGNWFVDANLKIQRFNQEKMVIINETFHL